MSNYGNDNFGSGGRDECKFFLPTFQHKVAAG